MTKYFAALLMFFVAWPSFAADPNGYTALYECRAGGPQCNVDVASLAAQSCGQTITTSTTPTTDWSAINQSNNVICIQNGDHSRRGELKLTASGNAGARKILRYTRSGDTDDDPWNQSTANKAILKRLRITGSFWIIHRITIDSNDGLAQESMPGSSDHIWSRVLMQNSTGWHLSVKGDRVTVQNSVFRKAGDHLTGGGGDAHCLSQNGGVNNHFVNNEVYDCTGDSLQSQSGGGMDGMVVENNDMYTTSDYYSNGSGTLDPNGIAACAENGLDLKQPGAIYSNPAKIIHNRFWGFKRTDTNCGGSGSGGEAIIIHGSAQGRSDYVLVQNNIFMDSPRALGMDAADAGNVSFIGNLGYNMRNTANSGAGGFFSMSDSTNSEFYLNTLVIAEDKWADVNGTNNDIRCNVIIDSPPHGSGPGSGVQVNLNVYYGVSGTKIDLNKIDITLNTRANSTTYSLGDIIRTSANPITACTATNNSSACFFYMVTTPGTSASSNPGYCNTLGCTQQDGTMQVRAIRGPYTFFRKLRTLPERYTIPYVRAYASTTNPLDNAPDAFACPFDYNARPGIGIN